MEGLGGAASVIGVINLSVKVISLCSQYSTAVSNAQADATRLETQVRGLKSTLERARGLVEGPNGPSLAASCDLVSQLDVSQVEVELKGLRDRLERQSTTARKTMRRFGLRALGWPFSREEVEAKVSSLERCQCMITNALQIDQTTLLLRINQGVDSLSLRANQQAPIAQRTSYFTVAFPRDTNFVQRPHIQAWIREQYAGPTRRMALFGLGGFGKSQIAIEFAYEVRNSQPETSVFWVNGDTRATFEESYQSLADTLALPGRHDSTANPLALVRDWLQKTETAPWLMILDNADNVDTFFAKEEGAPAASFLPRTGNGKILITSRNLNVAERLTGTASRKPIKEIPTMGDPQALQLFKHRLDSGFDQDAAMDLVRMLDSVPLAVNQAAAYINRRGMSIHSYMDRFGDSAKQKTSLLNHDAGDIRRRDDVSNSVVVTWQVTYEQIRLESPDAAKLLALMSLFQPQNIPRFMLSGYGEASVDHGGRGGSSVDSENDLDVLVAYSLVKKSTSEFYEMHSLVQLCTQAWLPHTEAIRVERLFLQLASKHFVKGNSEHLAKCRSLLPHVQNGLEKEPAAKTDVLEWLTLLDQVSLYMKRIGDDARGEPFIQRSLEVKRRLLGAEHADTLRSLQDLAANYTQQGRLEEAEELLPPIVEQYGASLGWRHIKTLRAMNDLAVVYDSQGRWEEAVRLYLHLREVTKEEVGAAHSKTLLVTNNLAAVYWRQGQLGAAERLLVQVVDVLKAELGVDHHDTLTTMKNLASTYLAQGRWEEAEEIYALVLERRKKQLGADAPATLHSMGSLADIYYRQGRWEEAEKLHVEAVELEKGRLGEHHPSTLMSMHNLACVWRRLGKHEALDLMRTCISISLRSLGPDHPDTKNSMSHLEAWEGLDRRSSSGSSGSSSSGCSSSSGDGGGGNSCRSSNSNR